MLVKYIAAVAILMFAAPVLHAQDQHGQHSHAQGEVKSPAEPAPGPQGGVLQQVGPLNVETVVVPTGVQIHLYDQQGNVVDIRRVRGTAILQARGEQKRYRLDLYPDVPRDKRPAGLTGPVDLSGFAGGEVRLAVQLAGVPGASGGRVRFAAAVQLPLSERQSVELAIAEQKTCPVSGAPLGSMGDPIAVELNNETVYVCCAGCIEPLQEKKSQAGSAKPNLRMASATAADASAIRLQKNCPVMDEPLGSMGAPLKVSGLERDVFLCCKGCLKFLEKEPAKYLAKLPQEPSKK